MKNAEIFHKTVGVLVKAYLNNTLQHEDCTACACGNLIAAANNFDTKYIGDNEFWVVGDCIENPSDWADIFSTTKVEKKRKVSGFLFWKKYLPYFEVTQTSNFENIDKRLQSIIKKTGYTVFEMAQIEYAFEFNDIAGGVSQDKRQYSGLMGVIDKLIEIHEGNEEEKKEAKSLFVKELAN